MGFYENHNVALTLSKGILDTFCKDILKSGVGFKGVYHTLFSITPTITHKIFNN